MTIQYPDTENRREMYSKLEQEQPDSQKKLRDNGAWTEHPIQFGNTEVDIERLAGYFETLERRLNLAGYCIEQIKEKCETQEIDPEDYERMRDLREVEDEIEPEFIMKVEYTIFSIKTALENLAHLLNLAYGLGVKPKYVNIMNILDEQEDDFSSTVDKAKQNWLTEFNKVRRRMAHHQIFTPVSNIEKTPPNEVRYYKRAITVDFSNRESETYPLPQYLEEVRDNARELVDEGFGRLNDFYTEPDQPNGRPMWELGIGHQED